MIDDHDEHIRIRAYKIWEEAGRPDGLEKQHWEQAARESEVEGLTAFKDPTQGLAFNSKVARTSKKATAGRK
ncbi:DUF2934 domain-containing protein [Mesorhizobium sp. M0166]|uniref:DUF2934 domain-containing protein n=1 Tax=Mesorhizobium sp. M0166 TaxID=2956902 RepID=UPI0033392F64